MAGDDALPKIPEEVYHIYGRKYPRRAQPYIVTIYLSRVPVDERTLEGMIRMATDTGAANPISFQEFRGRLGELRNAANIANFVEYVLFKANTQEQIAEAAEKILRYAQSEIPLRIKNRQ